MQYIETGLMMSAQRWDMQKPRIKGGRVVLLARNAGDNDDLIGLRRIVPAMPFDMFDQLRAHSVPGLFDLLIDVQQGAEGRDVETLESLKINGGVDQSQLITYFPTVAGKAQPESYYRPAPGSIVGLAVSATCYDMEDPEDSDSRIQGASVVFVQPYKQTTDNILGFEVFEVKMDYLVFHELKKRGLPGEYRFNCMMSSRTVRREGRAAKRHTPSLFITGLEGDNTLTADRLNSFFSTGKKDLGEASKPPVQASGSSDSASKPESKPVWPNGLKTGA